jgi:glycosyltransferase involved in cell wall biosynthesis
VTASVQPGGGEILAPPGPADLEPLAVPPAFSVVIPAYQAAETIAGAVGSALDQSLPAHEVIVVDDGSTDDLAGALSPFEGRIELVRKENGGVSSARNAGIEIATGEFVAILDADDRFHAQRLEALAELAVSRPDLDVLTTDTRFLAGGEVQGTFLERNPFATDDQRRAIFESSFVGWPAVRLSRLRAIGGFDEGLAVGEDWDCWLRLILSGSRAGLVNRPLYDYVVHAGSLTSDRRANLWARVALLEKAAANPALRAEDVPALRRALRRHRSRAVTAEARAKVDGAAPSAPVARLALSHGIEPKARVAALLAAVAPPLARRVLPGGPAVDERLAGGDR